MQLTNKVENTRERKPWKRRSERISRYLKSGVLEHPCRQQDPGQSISKKEYLVLKSIVQLSDITFWNTPTEPLRGWMALTTPVQPTGLTSSLEICGPRLNPLLLGAPNVLSLHLLTFTNSATDQPLFNLLAWGIN